MVYRHIRYLIVFSIFIIFMGCVSTPPYSPMAIQSAENFTLSPSYTIYNQNADTTVLFFKIDTRNLLYTRGEKNQRFEARLNLTIQVYENPEGGSKKMVYEDSIYFADIESTLNRNFLMASFSLPLPLGVDYVLYARLEDYNRGTENLSTLKVFKQENNYIRNAVLPLLSETKIPVVTPIITKKNAISLSYEWDDSGNLLGLFYPNTFGAALPPFMQKDEPVELTEYKMVDLTLDSSGEVSFKPGEEAGVYYFTKTKFESAGTQLYYFPEGFPKISTHKGMAKPLIYISADDEYRALIDSNATRALVEKFWIDKSGSKNRARRLLKEYYTRVEKANEFFSSYKEGWKTDRGMVYIIFGPPDNVNKKFGYEIWGYGRETNMSTLSFYFKQKDHPFTNEHFVLERNSSYRQIWYTAVDSWRSGRVFRY